MTDISRTCGNSCITYNDICAIVSRSTCRNAFIRKDARYFCINFALCINIDPAETSSTLRRNLTFSSFCITIYFKFISIISFFINNRFTIANSNSIFSSPFNKFLYSYPFKSAISLFTRINCGCRNLSS